MRKHLERRDRSLYDLDSILLVSGKVSQRMGMYVFRQPLGFIPQLGDAQHDRPGVASRELLRSARPLAAAQLARHRRGLRDRHLTSVDLLLQLGTTGLPDLFEAQERRFGGPEPPRYMLGSSAFFCR